jgi:RNase P/RNase MRP subunit POP5
VVLTLPTRANAIELLGAWSTEAELCNRVFTKKGNGIVFAERSDLFDLTASLSLIRSTTCRCVLSTGRPASICFS